MGSYKYLGLISGNDNIFKMPKYNCIATVMMAILISVILFCNIFDIGMSEFNLSQLLVITGVLTVSLNWDIAKNVEKAKLLKHDCTNRMLITIKLWNKLLGFERNNCKKYKKSTVTIKISYYITMLLLWIIPMSNPSSDMKIDCLITAILILFTYYKIQGNRIKVKKANDLSLFMYANHELFEAMHIELNISDDEFNRILSM